MGYHKKPKVNMTKLRLFRVFVKGVMFLLLNLTFFSIGATWLVLPVVMPRSLFTTSEGAFDLLQRMLTMAIIPLVPLAVFLLIGALVGRMFCAWACPIGLAQDIVGFTTSWKSKYEPTRETNLNLRQIGEFITGGTLLVSIFIGINVGLGNTTQVEDAFGAFTSQPWTLLSPATFLFVIIPGLFYWGGISNLFVLEELVLIDILFWVRLAIFLFAFILVIYVPKGWCRWLCPVGIIMGYMAKHSIVGVGRNVTKCTHCGWCEDVCPTGVRVLAHPPERVRSEQCINCLDCIAICPDDAMELKLF
jgi:polyferredoxin